MFGLVLARPSLNRLVFAYDLCVHLLGSGDKMTILQELNTAILIRKTLRQGKKASNDFSLFAG